MTGHTVLLVDDEVEVLEGLKRTLRSEGYHLLTALSAEEALSRLDAGGVDLLLSDIDMPGMTGLELVARVRRSHPGVVRMLLTGDASLESALEAINGGEVHRYLTKPWDKYELRETLRQALSRLDELRRAADAGQAAHTREQLLTELEREHPGIRTVGLDEGAYLLDGRRLDAVLARLPRDTRSFFEAAAITPPGANRDGGAPSPDEEPTRS